MSLHQTGLSCMLTDKSHLQCYQLSTIYRILKQLKRPRKVQIPQIQNLEECSLEQRLANFFQKGPDSKYFRLCGPHTVLVTYSPWLCSVLFYNLSKNIKTIHSSNTVQKQTTGPFWPMVLVYLTPALNTCSLGLKSPNNLFGPFQSLSHSSLYHLDPSFILLQNNSFKMLIWSQAFSFPGNFTGSLQN